MATRAKGGAAKAKALKVPHRGHVQDRILDSLRRGLMAGAFVPGQVMSLRPLAEAFGTSPMPVRDALNQLVAAGALEETPGRSVRVPRLTGARLKDLFDVRERVEGLAARNAAAKADGDLRTRLAATNDELRAAISRRDVVAALLANQIFHFALYEAADSAVLMPLIESLWLQCGPTMYCSFLAPGMPWDASAHGEVLKGLRAKSPVLVERAIVRDIRTAGRDLQKSGAFELPGAASLAGFLEAPIG